MIAASVIAVALLAVPVVLLFATSGCGLDPIDVRYDDPETPPQRPAEEPKPSDPLAPQPGATLTTPYWNQVLGAQGLVGYWRLGESSPLQPAVNSFSSTGVLNGAYVGGAAGITLGQDGILSSDPDTAAYFTGLGGYVNVVDHSWLNTTSVTAEFWVQWRQDLVGWSVLMGRFEPNLDDDRVTRGYRVRSSTERRLDGTGKIHIQGILGDMPTALAAEVDLVFQQWHYVVMTYDNAKKIAELWVDGVMKDSKSGDFKAQVLNARPLRLAANQAAVLVATFTGVLDEVAIYNKALSKMDIENHFAAAKQ